MILGSDIMNEIIKTYLYSNNYFLMVRYTGNEIDNNIISRELDNKYSRKIELSTFDILSLIEGISSNIKGAFLDALPCSATLDGIRKCIEDYLEDKTDIINSPDKW